MHMKEPHAHIREFAPFRSPSSSTSYLLFPLPIRHSRLVPTDGASEPALGVGGLNTVVPCVKGSVRDGGDGTHGKDNRSCY
jgi:hypothetical protein